MSKVCFNINEYLPAEYKGIRFNVTDMSIQSGRRGALGEFIYSDNIGYIDIGRRARQYTLNGYYYGNDHIEKARILQRICESEGEGLLIHPTQGEIYVSCLDFTVRNDVVRGIGHSEFSISFIESPHNTNIGDLFRHVFNLDFYHMFEDILNLFKIRYNVNSLHDLQLSNLHNKIFNFMKFVQSIILNNTFSDSKLSLLNSIERALNNRKIVDDADSMANFIENSVLFIDRDIVNTNLKLQILRDYINFGAKDQDISNPIKNAFYTAIRIISLIKMCEIYKKNYLTDIKEVLKILKIVSNIFDSELDLLSYQNDSIMYLKVNDYKTNIINYFYNAAYTAKQFTTYNFNHSIPPLVAAWEIYRDADKVNELRNLNLSKPFQFDSTIIARI